VEPILPRPRFLIFLWVRRSDCSPKLRGSRIFMKLRSRKERSMFVAPLMSRINLGWRARVRRSKTSHSLSRCRVPRLQNKSND
jgi:hypothetical protein